MYVTARLSSDGADEDGGDIEWDDDSGAGCNDCGWGGLVGQFIQVNSGDQSLGDDDIPGVFWFPSQGWALALVDDDSWNYNVEVVTTDAWCDNGIELSRATAKRRAVRAGLVFGDDERPYKVTGFAERRNA